MNRIDPAEAIDELLKSLTDDELEFIASRDYGIDADLHLAELRKLVASQGGLLTEGQHWYPYEVIELGAHRWVHGHDREFAVCTLLVVRAVDSGFDMSTSLEMKLEDRAADYQALQARLGDVILRAYESVGFSVSNAS